MIGTIRPFCYGVQTLFLRGGNDHRPYSLRAIAESAAAHVRRAKNGKPSVHPLRGEEIRALRELRRQFPDSAVHH